jgi:glycosyltransferase involved in cell wall biosynthesis
MRITFVLPPLNATGGIRSNAELAAALQRRGHEVLAVFPPKEQVPLHRRLNWFVSGKGWKKNIRRAPSYFDKSPVPQRELDRHRPVTGADVPDADAVIATWWETAEWVRAMPKSKGAPVYMIRHHETLTSPRDVERAAATYRLPFHKVTISKWLVDVMNETYGDRDVSLVPNSVDPGVFNCPPRERGVRPTVSLMVADEPLKGTATAVAVLKKVQESVPDLNVLAFGFRRPQIEFPNFFTFVENPKLEALKNLYASSDLFLYTSVLEGFGRPALEAMACRCPLVSTAVGGPSDFIKQGVDGFISPIDDVEDLAKNVKSVLAMSPGEWKAMSEAAHQTTASYTWDHAGERMERALERAIERRRAGEI